MSNFGIYFLINLSEVVYIGQTKDITGRLKNHRDKEFTSYRFIQCDMMMLNYYESRWINRFKPQYNKTDKTNVSRGNKKYPNRHELIIEETVYEKALRLMKAQNRSFNNLMEFLIIQFPE